MSKQDLKTLIHSLERSQQVNEKLLTETLQAYPNVRIACVAAIIRWNPYTQPVNNDVPETVEDFFNQGYVNDTQGRAEMLYIQRAKRPGDFWSGHIAFPGGKDEKADKSNLDTVTRECMEEIGLDLTSNEYRLLGTLELRSLRNDEGVPSMILVPHVFLKVTPEKPKLTLQESEVAQTFWIPVKYLLHTPITPYDPIAENMVDAKEAGKYNWPSSFKTPSIPFVNDQGPRLWGMTLRMTQDILDIPVTGHTIQIDEDDKVQVTTDKSKL